MCLFTEMLSEDTHVTEGIKCALHGVSGMMVVVREEGPGWHPTWWLLRCAGHPGVRSSKYCLNMLMPEIIQANVYVAVIIQTNVCVIYF